MDSATFVRAVEELRDRQGCAPTTGDVAASLGNPPIARMAVPAGDP